MTHRMHNKISQINWGGISSASQSKKITVRCILQRTCVRIYGIPQTEKHLNSVNRSNVQTLFMSRNLQAVFIKHLTAGLQSVLPPHSQLELVFNPNYLFVVL